MKIFTQSWHNRLATFYGPINRGYSDRQVDFCKYFWAAVKGSFAVLGILFAAFLVCIPVGDFIAWIVAMIALGTLIPVSGAGLALATFLVLGSTLTAGVGLVKYVLSPIKSVLIDNLALDDSTAEKFSFLSTWWYSIKNKVCVPITLKGERPGNA